MKKLHMYILNDPTSDRGSATVIVSAANKATAFRRLQRHIARLHRTLGDSNIRDIRDMGPILLSSKDDGIVFSDLEHK